MEPRFNEVAGDRPNLFVKSRVRYIECLDITNLRGNDQNVRYIEVVVKGAGSPLEHAHSGLETELSFPWATGNSTFRYCMQR